MSCSIDPRLGLEEREVPSLLKRGSILMEFVLVLPIYIFLFGALFLLGDMGLNAIRISTGDRDAAMDAGDGLGFSTSIFLTQQMREEALKTFSESRTCRADDDFKGAWSWQAAGKTLFAYTLPSYGAGLVSYPYLRYGAGATLGGNVLGTLVGGGTVLFHSKDYSIGDKVRSYNYYTLKRTDLARDPEAYRNWDSWDSSGKQNTSRSRLTQSARGLKQHWYANVYGEDYADSSPDSLDNSGRQGNDELPNRPSGRGEYKRLDLFVTWSQ